jgi:hypothetical protein
MRLGTAVPKGEDKVRTRRNSFRQSFEDEQSPFERIMLNATNGDEDGAGGVEVETKKTMTPLRLGDLVSLNLEGFGLLKGDIVLKRLGVEREHANEYSEFPESCFRICPKLNYRAKWEFSQISTICECV